MSCSRERRFAKAEAAILEGVRRQTNSADAYLRLGSFYKIVGRVYQSRLAFEKAVTLSPRDPRAYEFLANSYSGWWGLRGEGFDRKSIMAVYDRAATNLPVAAWTINRKAELCMIDDVGRADSTNQLAEADALYRALLKEDAQNYKGLLGLAEVNRLRGDYDAAEDYYRKAGRVQPDEVAPRAGIWIAMAFAGRDEEAINAMAAYYGRSQDMLGEVARVATTLMLSRRYDASANLYERVLGSLPRPEAIQKLVRVLRKAEKIKREDYAFVLRRHLAGRCGANHSSSPASCRIPTGSSGACRRLWTARRPVVSSKRRAWPWANSPQEWAPIISGMFCCRLSK